MPGRRSCLISCGGEQSQRGGGTLRGRTGFLLPDARIPGPQDSSASCWESGWDGPHRRCRAGVWETGAKVASPGEDCACRPPLPAGTDAAQAVKDILGLRRPRRGAAEFYKAVLAIVNTHSRTVWVCWKGGGHRSISHEVPLQGFPVSLQETAGSLTTVALRASCQRQGRARLGLLGVPCSRCWQLALDRNDCDPIQDDTLSKTEGRERQGVHSPFLAGGRRHITLLGPTIIS